MTLKVVDLFSGIGGFALGLQMAGPFETVCFVEIDPFCQKVLKKNFPGVPIYDDIKKIQWVVADTSEFQFQSNGGLDTGKRMGSTEEGSYPTKSHIVNVEPIDILTGGFPCQPFSCAGKRAGTEDDRFLWPEMLRAVHEIKSRWVLAENVPGLLTLQDGVVFEGVCADLEGEGYEVLPLVIPACAQGAPHRRDRVWIVGHSKSCEGRILQREGWRKDSHLGGSDCYAPDTENGNGSWKLQKSDRESRTGKEGMPDRGCSWGEHWYEVATRLCRVDDGVPSRVDRLKCLGNAIVPQIAEQIFKAIKETEKIEKEGRK